MSLFFVFYYERKISSLAGFAFKIEIYGVLLGQRSPEIVVDPQLLRAL